MTRVQLFRAADLLLCFLAYRLRIEGVQLGLLFCLYAASTKSLRGLALMGVCHGS